MNLLSFPSISLYLHLFTPVFLDQGCSLYFKQTRLIDFDKCQIKNIHALKNLTNIWFLHLNLNEISDLTPLRNLSNLRELYLATNQIQDISVLEYLTNLNRIRLWDNQITDILPLVKNSGLGKGDLVSLQGNPLSEKSINEYIPILRSRGVIVFWP